MNLALCDGDEQSQRLASDYPAIMFAMIGQGMLTHPSRLISEWFYLFITEHMPSEIRHNTSAQTLCAAHISKNRLLKGYISLI